jgi:hypothetical protein
MKSSREAAKAKTEIGTPDNCREKEKPEAGCPASGF